MRWPWTKKTPSGQDAPDMRQTADPRLRALYVPMVLLENHEKLDNPRLRELCASDFRIQYRCIMCERNADNIYTCPGCQSAYYCSAECRAEDQPYHALVCNQWHKFKRRPRRHTTVRRMLLFPARDTSPVVCWTKLVRFPGEPSPRLAIPHPEAVLFARHIFPDAPVRHSVGRLICINGLRVIAATKPMGLGHGLFALELAAPASSPANVSAGWINRSIPHATRRPPEETWQWTGPLAIIALDVDRTRAAAAKFILDDIHLRDVRHAIDFLTLTARNPTLPRPPSSRYPFTSLPAIFLHAATPPFPSSSSSPGPDLRLTQVHVPRHPAFPLEGISVLCAALDLPWAVRAAPSHGPELNWLHTTDPQTNPSETPPTIPPILQKIYTLHPSTLTLTTTLLPGPSGGLTLLHASGAPLHPSHVRALLSFLRHTGLHNIDDTPRALGREGEFRRFWAAWAAGHGGPERMGEEEAVAVVSPYEAGPTVSGARPGQRFVVCAGVVGRLVLGRGAGVRVRGDGVCVKV